MQEPLIHIGYHKTGTTWLENELFTADNNIFQPLSLQDKGHSSLAKYLIYSNDNRLLSTFSSNNDTIRDKLNYIIDNQDIDFSKIPVISHERLSGNPHSGGFDAKIIAERIRINFPKAKIFIVIREQKSFILSNYFQYLSIGGTHSLKRYLNIYYDGRRPCFSPHHVNYVPLIKEYMKLFGSKNVLVLPYELFKSKPNKFIYYLENFLDKKIHIESTRFNIRQNIKQNLFANYYLRSLNLLIERSSVNNYSSASNTLTMKLALILLNSIRTLSPTLLDNKLHQKMRKEINEWCGNRYIENKTELSILINLNLSKYGYH